MGFKAPYISRDELVRRAEAFLRQHHPSRDLPVPIEKIVEFGFGIDIVPVPGLQSSFDVVAYITRDRKEIRVDQYVFESREKRYRFSLAHEMGHFVLHPELFEYLHFDNIAAWKKAITDSIPENEYRFLEWHANCFAGLVLVPQAELVAAFEAWRGKLARLGLNLEEQGDGVWDALEEYIGREFVASADVIHKRLEFDGLLEIAAGSRVRPKGSQPG